MANLIPKPMSKGIDTKGCLLDEEEPQDPCIYQTSFPITPAKSSDDHWEQHAENKNEFTIVPVLPDDDGVLVQVRDISPSLVLGVLLQYHPHEVGVPYAFPYTVRVFDSIGPPMVSSVFAAPPSDGALDRTATNTGKKDSQR